MYLQRACGAKLTFRCYKCTQCHSYRETIELPCGLFENIDTFDHLAVLQRVQAERRSTSPRSANC
jgi:hypothetical protein